MANPEPARPLTVGIIGAGQIVRDLHLPVLASMAGVTPRWIIDLDRSVARRTARAFGITEFDPGIEGLPTADIYLLAIPYGTRQPYYTALRSRDAAALYVEKPLALDAAEHRQICEGFDDWKIGHGLQRRSFGPTLLVRNLIRERIFGELESVRFAMGHPGGGRYSGFRSDFRQSGGGILFEHGIHLLDSVLFLTGARSARVEAVKMSFEADLDVHAQARFVVDTVNGPEVDCRFEFSWLTETEPGIVLDFAKARLSYSIYDEQGEIRVSPADAGMTCRLQPDAQERYSLSAAQTLHGHWQRFVDGLRARRANYTAASQSMLTTQVVEECYRLGRKS